MKTLKQEYTQEQITYLYDFLQETEKEDSNVFLSEFNAWIESEKKRIHEENFSIASQKDPRLFIDEIKKFRNDHPLLKGAIKRVRDFVFFYCFEISEYQLEKKWDEIPEQAKKFTMGGFFEIIGRFDVTYIHHKSRKIGEKTRDALLLFIQKNRLDDSDFYQSKEPSFMAVFEAFCKKNKKLISKEKSKVVSIIRECINSQGDIYLLEFKYVKNIMSHVNFDDLRSQEHISVRTIQILWLIFEDAKK